MLTNPTPRRAGRTAAALLVATALALASGCSLLPQVSHASSSPSAGGASSPATSAVPDAQPLPVGTPVPVQDLGSLSYDDQGSLVVTLTGVRRTSDEMGQVTVTLHAQQDAIGLWVFADPALRHSFDKVSDEVKRQYLSGVSLTAAGDPTVYQAVADAQDDCLCSRLPLTLDAGSTISAYAYVTLPPAATTVDVTVGPVGPWKDVPVS